MSERFIVDVPWEHRDNYGVRFVGGPFGEENGCFHYFNRDALAVEPMDQQGRGPCAGCGHDPACGFASVYRDGVERWLCHCDSHSCYAPAGWNVMQSVVSPTS